MTYEQIEVEDRDGIRVIRLNRPDKLNAWTFRMGREMSEALRTGNDDPSIGAFVFTGAGRGFCAGADVSDVFGQQIAAADDAATEGDDATPNRDDGGAPAEGGRGASSRC